jgi:FMN phosphatase YigB (HAD superfamily)
MANPIVVFDLDGVLLDFESAWHRCAEWTLNREVKRLCNDYPLADRFGLSSQEVRRVWETFHQENWWDRVPLYDEAWEVVEELERMGASLWAVTNVDACHHQSRAISLQGLIPSGRIVTLGEHASPEDRVGILRDLGASAFADDRMDHVKAAQPYVPCAV